MNLERWINAMYASGPAKLYIILLVYNNVAVIRREEDNNFFSQKRERLGVVVNPHHHKDYVRCVIFEVLIMFRNKRQCLYPALARERESF